MGYIILEECTGCYVCLDHCTEKAIIPGEIFSIDKMKCTECAQCVSVCPLNVIIFQNDDNLKSDKNDKT